MDVNANRSPIADAQLDRLVDGALPPPDRRALLARLETEPDGWRRCALAFLQAQAWREALGPIATPDEDRDAPTADVSTRHRPRLRIVPVAMAAGLAVAAFVLGRSTGGDGRQGPSDRPTGLVASTRADPSAPVDPPSTPLDAGEAKVAEIGPSAVPVDPTRWPPEVQTIGYLSLPTAVAPDAPVVQLPVYAGPGLDDRWLRDQPSFVPDEVRQGWERRGYDVESQRRLVSVQVDESGRYLTIPVDEVRLRGAPRATY